MLEHERILVVAAHPDDEVLGCGGVIGRLTRLGKRVTVLILGEGLAARTGKGNEKVSEEAFQAIRRCAEKAADILGVSDLICRSFPDNRFDAIPLLDIVHEIERVKGQTRPSLVLTHHRGDLNVDHAITHRAVLTAFRPLPGEAPVEILSFEVPSSTEYAGPDASKAFLPDTFVEVEDSMDRKLAALRCYPSELRPPPHPRSLESVDLLARVRGSQVGFAKAEAFETLRRVIPAPPKGDPR